MRWLDVLQTIGTDFTIEVNQNNYATRYWLTSTDGTQHKLLQGQFEKLVAQYNMKVIRDYTYGKRRIQIYGCKKDE